MAGFDFDASPVDCKLVTAQATSAFTDDAHNVVLVGGPGTGKHQSRRRTPSRRRSAQNSLPSITFPVRAPGRITIVRVRGRRKYSIEGTHILAIAANNHLRHADAPRIALPSLVSPLT